MPTLEELKAQMAQEGVNEPAERNQRLAQAVKTGALTRALGGEPQAHVGPELKPEEARQKWEGYQHELSDEEVAQRMGEEQPTFEGIVKRMAQNYQTSPQYAQLLDQELQQISAQIAELTQRRNMIEMAKRGQG